MRMSVISDNLLRLYRDEIYRCRETYHNSLLKNIHKIFNKEYKIEHFNIRAPRIYDLVWNECEKTMDRLSDEYHNRFISNLNSTIEIVISEIKEILHKILKVDKLYEEERPKTEVDKIGGMIASELARSITEIFSDIIDKRDIIEVLLTFCTQTKDLADELYNLSKEESEKEGELYIHSKKDRLCFHGALLLFYLKSNTNRVKYFKSKFVKIIEGLEILKRDIKIESIINEVKFTILGDRNPKEIIDIFKIDKDKWLDIEPEDMIDVLNFLRELYRFLKEKMEIDIEIRSEDLITKRSLTEIQEGLLWIKLLECGIPSLPDIHTLNRQWDILSWYPEDPYITVVSIDLKIGKKIKRKTPKKSNNMFFILVTNRKNVKYLPFEIKESKEKGIFLIVPLETLLDPAMIHFMYLLLLEYGKYPFIS